MKKLLSILSLVVLTGCNSLSVTNDQIVNTLNTVIQLPVIQNATFKVVDGCTDSTLNDIEFCDSLEAKDSYKTSVVDDACVDAAKAIQDSENFLIDETRKACKTGCAAVDWTCNDCCSKGCQSASDAAKSGTQAEYDATVAACSYLDITGGYDFKLKSVTGVGGLVVTSATMTGQDMNDFFVNLTLTIPSVKAIAHYKIWQDPIPAISGDTSVEAINTPVTATATLISAGEDIYILQIDTLTITIPDNLYDSNELLEIANMLAIDINFLTGGLVDLNKIFEDWANTFLANEIISILNDELKNYPI